MTIKLVFAASHLSTQHVDFGSESG